MTTASDGESPRRPPISRLNAWITHASIWIAAICVLPSTVLLILHPGTRLPNLWWTIAPSLFLTVVYGVIFVHEQRGMCIRCMEEVPADAAIRATRVGWDRRLLWFHHYNYLSAIVLFGLDLVIRWPAFALTWNAQILGLVMAWRTHRLLRPWCPWCRRWGGGGEHERVPDPTPSARATR